ncbi:hypothetical protein [Scale drop disease virus]|nr:hypothetical protein [Scale drop disease virus]QXJ13658.1 ORF068R [Scale drop disease virus]
MFTEEQIAKLNEVEKQTSYYKNAYKLEGMPQAMSEHAVQIDRVVNILGFNKDPTKSTRLVDVIINYLCSKVKVDQSKPEIPPGWAVMPHCYKTDAQALVAISVYKESLEQKLLQLLNESKDQLKDLVIDNSTNGTSIQRIDRFIRTCEATMEYLTEDEKIFVLNNLSWYYDKKTSNFSVLRMALDSNTIYPNNYDACEYVRRIKQHNRLVYCLIPGMEPIIKIRGRFFKLISRDKHYRYWIDCKCMRPIARLTGIRAVEWRSTIEQVEPIVSVNDLFCV